MKSQLSFEEVNKANSPGMWAIYREGDQMSSVPLSIEPISQSLRFARLLALCSPLVTVQSPYRSHIYGFTPCVLFEGSDDDMYFACDRMHGDLMGAILGLAVWQEANISEHAGGIPEVIEMLSQEAIFKDAIRRMLNRKNDISPREWTNSKMPVLKAEAARRDLPVCDETTLCCDLFRSEHFVHWNYSYSYGREKPLSERLARVIDSFDLRLRNKDREESRKGSHQSIPTAHHA
jgi:hypothetical protein